MWGQIFVICSSHLFAKVPKSMVMGKPNHHFKTSWAKPNRLSWDFQVHSENFKYLVRAGKLRRIRRDIVEQLWADKVSQMAAPSGCWAQKNTRNYAAAEGFCPACCHSGIEGSPWCSPRPPPRTHVPASSSILFWQPPGWPVWKCLTSVMGLSSELLLNKILSQQGLWDLGVRAKPYFSEKGSPIWRPFLTKPDKNQANESSCYWAGTILP